MCGRAFYGRDHLRGGRTGDEVFSLCLHNYNGWMSDLLWINVVRAGR